MPFGLAERGSGLGREEGPGRYEVARRVADTRTTEVDDGREVAGVGEEVAGEEVGVDPGGGGGPLGEAEGLLPDGGRERRVHRAVRAEATDRVPDFVVLHGHRATTEGCRPARGVHLAERGQPPGTCGRIWRRR